MMSLEPMQLFYLAVVSINLPVQSEICGTVSRYEKMLRSAILYRLGQGFLAWSPRQRSNPAAV